MPINNDWSAHPAFVHYAARCTRTQTNATFHLKEEDVALVIASEGDGFSVHLAFLCPHCSAVHDLRLGDAKPWGHSATGIVRVDE